jgi:uncharacterized protein YecE (DUF72 family)
MAKVLIGTSGFYYPHWFGNFYPQDLKKAELLSFYSQRFNTVEINSSFYHILKPKTVENWSKKVPKDFVFTFKMSRFVTHVKKLACEKESLNLFFNSLFTLKSSKTKQLVLIQLPPSLKINREKLINFIGMLPKNFLYAFEFRHQSWFADDIYKILKKFNMAVVLSDSPNHLWPYVNIETANFFYIRFHGSKRLFSSSYSDRELKFYAKLIKEKLKRGMNVYAYFNNDAEGRAVENAKKLKSLL